MATTVAPGTRGTVELALRGRRADVRGRAFQATLLLTLLLALAFLVVLLWTTWIRAYPVFQDRGLSFVTGNVSALASRVGVRQGIVGSLWLIAFVAVTALPLGVAAAIYLQEYARDTRLNRLLITNIRNLAGVPSIVFGILGLVVFARALRSITGPGVAGLSLMTGGLTLSVLVMPIVILVTMEALRAVPKSLREAAYGVGATRWEVVRSHVLPYAAPGIFTGTILSLARAFGETAPILMVGAVLGYLSPAPRGQMIGDVLRGSRYTALPAQIFNFSRQIGEDWRANAAAAIIVLLVIILAVNAVAIVLRNRYERKW
jgi:phosphate transport system permease protein